MTNEELVYLYQNGDKWALEELTRKNQGMINKLANKFYLGRTSSIDFEDLQQEGYIGLITAADKHDLNNPKKALFITYAVYWIYQKMNRFIKSKNTNDETSLNSRISDDTDHELMDTIQDENNHYEGIEDKIYNQQLRAELEEVMFDKLTMKEIEIIKLHYGWDGNKCMTLQEIGEVFGFTRSAANNIERIAFGKMRRTPWGSEQIKKIYKSRFQYTPKNISGVDEKISFVERYFTEVM